MKVATAWIRDLTDSGYAVRRHVLTGALVGRVSASGDAFEWYAEAAGFAHIGKVADRELAKRHADGVLRLAGYRLADVPGHTIEES